MSRVRKWELDCAASVHHLVTAIDSFPNSRNGNPTPEWKPIRGARVQFQFNKGF